MSNLLELRTDNAAVKVASYYGEIIERKEIYLKQLIINALNRQSFYVNISDSLFYSSEFYSKTRIFDFYVNNNLFDLIVLKPNSDQMLFDVQNDDIHGNVYGYVVARITQDACNTEILGYFDAKEFSSVVTWNMVDTSKLKPIENFANISIMDSQISLDDVSERFFGLLSLFMDSSIDETDFSELACLLYNSSELREVFRQINKFEHFCSDIKDNFDTNKKSYISTKEPITDNSYVSVPDELSAVLPPEEIVIEKVNQIPTAEDNLIEELTEQDIYPESADNLQTEEISLSDISNESTAIIEDSPVLELSDSLSEFLPDEKVEDEPIEVEEVLDEKTLDELEEFTFEIVEDVPAESQPEEDELKVEEVSTQDKEKLSLVSDYEEIEEIEDKLTEDAEVVNNITPVEEVIPVEEISSVEETPSVEINDEIMQMLDDTEDDVHIDNNEIMSILEDDIQSEKAVVDDGEYKETKITIPIIPEEQAQPDITMLYGEKTTSANAAMLREQKVLGLSKTKRQIAAIAALVVICGGVWLYNNYSINPANIASNEQDVTAEDYEFPQEPDTNEHNVPDMMATPVAQPEPDDTKLVTSRAKETGAAPVILKAVAWQVPTSMSNDAVFNKYLQIAGKNIKLNLASDLLGTDDFAYNNKIKVSMTVKNNAAIRNIKIIESSGSKNVDEIVLQSIKLTLKYINTPVMSSDSGDRDVILVISI